MNMKAEYAKSSGKKENAAVVPSKSRTAQAAAPAVDHVIHLQRSIGNQAVQRLFNSGIIRAKLKIGDPNDIYEQEADRVADKVMRMPAPEIRMNPT